MQCVRERTLPTAAAPTRFEGWERAAIACRSHSQQSHREVGLLLVQLLLLSLVNLFLKGGNNFAKHFFAGILVDFPVEQDIHVLMVFPDQIMKFRNNFITFIYEFTYIAHMVPAFVSPVHSVITDFPRMLSDL